MNEKREEMLTRILSEEAVGRILTAPDLQTREGRRDRAMLGLFCDTGLKVKELTGLRLKDIDLQISCLLLPAGKETPFPVRMIPFGIGTRTALLSWIYDIRETAGGPDTVIFPGREGKEMSRQAVWKIIRRYGKTAGAGEAVSPEDLRATFAVSLLTDGADPEAVRHMLGIGTAGMKRYLLLAQERERNPA